ncbi:hypothetical protein Pint_06129 [Pistacia integerrima]|uniref:Uncharacterized protein n=1 Tax=Pistacia integerrima TaxID=434235 RepID=A0ACC0ZB77_9ROSI|nr:hypothetical protein Pint_06129 [Pistacia integerrima]
MSFVSHTIKLPNGTTTLAMHVGDIHLSDHIVLKHVLCVPAFSFNLLSAKSLTTHSNCYLIFFSNSCYIQDLSSWRTIGMGTMHNGLYHLQPSTPVPNALKMFLSNSCSSYVNTTNTSKFDDYKLWHYRLGHSSMTQHVLNEIQGL